jgi:hypothetical protein
MVQAIAPARTRSGPGAADHAPLPLPPTVFVLFGGSGDLARRMVLPAFFELAQRGMLPEEWRLVGAGRPKRRVGR